MFVPPVAKPDIQLREFLDRNTHSGFYKCWTCGECDGVCPVNIATNGLHPQKIVHLAYLGWLEELLHLPEIWHCLSCRQCNQVCSNRVRPADIIDFARIETVRRGMVSYDAYRQYKDLNSMFQRVRWHAVTACFNGRLDDLSDEQWSKWLRMPISMATGRISGNSSPLIKMSGWPLLKANTNLCFTCGECSSACPVFCERGLFDPQAIVRMVNLNLADELMASASIWLCLGCERCTDTCPQTLRPRQVIKNLQDLAKSQGIVDASFEFRLRHADRITYHRFLKEIDKIFNFPTPENDYFRFNAILTSNANKRPSPLPFHT